MRLFWYCGSTAAAIASFPLCLVGASPAEIALYKEQQESNDTIAVRRKAEEMLQKDANAFVALLVEGLIEYDKGHYPETISLYRRATEMFPRWQTKNLSSDLEPQWQALLLYRMAEAYGAMDRRRDELAVLEEYERAHFAEFEQRNKIARSAVRMRIVALLKLGREKEAERVLEQVISDPNVSESARADLRRDDAKIRFVNNPDGIAAYRVYQDIAGTIKGSGRELDGSLLYLLGFHALRQLDVQSASNFYRQAATRISAEDSTNPFERLSEIDVASCRWTSTRTDLKEAWRWLRTKRGRVRQEMTKDLALSAGVAWLAMGYPEQAMPLTDSSLDDPQRTGDTMITITQWKARAAVVRLLALDETSRFEKDIFAQMSIKARIERWPLRIGRAIEYSTVQNELRALISSELTQPGKVTDALSLIISPPSLWIELPRLIGAQTCRQLLRSYPLCGKMKEGYEDALMAEIEYRSGRMEAALTMTQSALLRIPEWESMLRARMYLIAGLAQGAGGSKDIPSLVLAYRTHPAVFLQSGERFPVAVRPQPGAPVWAVSAAKDCSELTVQNSSGLILSIAGKGDAATFKVFSPDQEELASFEVHATPDIATGRTDPSAAIALLQRNLFAVRPLLETQEFAALNGKSVTTEPQERAATR
jgi:tetratricopeptide (TPR) repeat protein